MENFGFSTFRIIIFGNSFFVYTSIVMFCLDCFTSAGRLFKALTVEGKKI